MRGLDAIAPRAMADLLRIGRISRAQFAQRCTYRELRGTVWHCREPAIVLCGACGAGRCLDPQHTYTGFCTLRDSAPWETGGSKFFYYCSACADFLCVYCLGIEDEYPCPAGQLESHEFPCPGCRNRVQIVRVDGVDSEGVVNTLAGYPSRMLRMAPSHEQP